MPAKGQHFSEEAKAKRARIFSEGKKGKPGHLHTPESKAKIAAAHTGMLLSDDAKAKIGSKAKERYAVKLQREPAETRFWAHVEKMDNCWTWQGNRNKWGYGIFNTGGKRWRAHRYAYRLTNGEIPDGLFICHRCDNPPCVRPDHLYLGTCADNTRDAASKGKLSRPGNRSPRSAETKAKISASHKGIPMSEEAKRKLSEAKRGKPGTWLGRHHTPETRARLVETWKRRKERALG